MLFRNSRQNTRKSQILGEFTVVAFSLLALIFILIIFYILMSLNTHQNTFEIHTVTNDVDLEIMLNNLLLTPVNIDSHKLPLHQALAFTINSDISHSSVKKQLESQVSDLLTIAENYYPNYIIGTKKKSMVQCRALYKMTINHEYSTIIDADSSHMGYLQDLAVGSNLYNLFMNYKTSNPTWGCDRDWNVDKDTNPNIKHIKRTYTYSDGSQLAVELFSIMVRVT